jgi:glutathione S-transferase
VLERHYPPRACDGSRLPKGVRKSIERARTLIDQELAAGGVNPAARRIRASLERAARRTRRADMSRDCRHALLALLADAAGRNPAP